MTLHKRIKKPDLALARSGFSCRIEGFGHTGLGRSLLKRNGQTRPSGPEPEPGPEPELRPQPEQRRHRTKERSKPERSKRAGSKPDGSNDEHAGERTDPDDHRNGKPSGNHRSCRGSHRNHHCKRSGNRDQPTPCCSHRPRERCRPPRRKSRCQKPMHDSFLNPPLNRYRTVRENTHAAKNSFPPVVTARDRRN